MFRSKDKKCNFCGRLTTHKYYGSLYCNNICYMNKTVDLNAYNPNPSLTTKQQSKIMNLLVNKDFTDKLYGSGCICIYLDRNANYRTRFDERKTSVLYDNDPKWVMKINRVGFEKAFGGIKKFIKHVEKNYNYTLKPVESYFLKYYYPLAFEKKENEGYGIQTYTYSGVVNEMKKLLTKKVQDKFVDALEFYNKTGVTYLLQMAKLDQSRERV